MVKAIESAEEFQQILSANEKVFVDFHAVWCGPCKMIAPEVEKLANTYKDIFFCKVDVDEVAEVAEKYDVQAMPTFLMFLNGEKSDTLVGASKDKLTAFVEKNK